MEVGQAGLDLIKASEGLRLNAYRDGVGVRTIGWGHTAEPFPNTITEDQAETYLISDLESVEDAINNSVTVALTQNQFDALCSFAFNEGVGAFERSTLLKKLNKGDYQGAADQLLIWDKQKDYTTNSYIVVSGLHARRERERSLFLTEE